MLIDVGKKLSVKIFIAFLLVALASVGMLTIADRFFAGKNFENYLRYKDLKLVNIFRVTIEF